MKETHCLNCNSSLKGKFCSSCGQKADTHRLDWHYLWHDLPHSILHLDKGIFYTIKELTVRPATTIREFLKGKRVNHFRPLMYLLITGTIAGLIYSNIEVDSAFARDEATQQLLQQYQKYQGKFFNAINLALLPLQALVSWIFFRKFLNYIEIFTVLCFTMGHLNWLSLVSLFTSMAGGAKLQLFGSLAAAAISFGYSTVVFSQLTNFKSAWKNVLYPMIAWILNYVLISIIVILAILIYLAFKEGGQLNINYGI